jgi:hypothetical protein
MEKIFEANGICVLNFDRIHYMTPVKGQLYLYRFDANIKFYYFKENKNVDSWILLTNTNFKPVYGVKLLEYKQPLDEYDTGVSLFILSQFALVKKVNEKGEEKYYIFYDGKFQEISKNILFYKNIFPSKKFKVKEIKPPVLPSCLQDKIKDLI